MKKLFLLTALVLVAGLDMTAQHQRFKKTKTGLRYCYETRNRKAPQPKVGDYLVGEMTLVFDTFTVFSNLGNPGRIFRVTESTFPGDINEGLLMMHQGDKMSFIVPADSVAAHVGVNKMPPNYRQGNGQEVHYTVILHDILTTGQVERERDSIRAVLATRKQEEPRLLAAYVKEHYRQQIEMTMEGLYIVVNKKGDGTPVFPGRKVSVEYTGRLLDGTVFDSGSLSYVVGQTRLIKGWEDGIDRQPAGTELTILVPSTLAYGERGTGKIPPYSSLIFDIKILSVE